MRVPVGLRRYIDLQYYWSSFPDMSLYDPASAQISGADLHVHGQIGDGIHIHYAARIAAGDYPSSDEWAATVDADSCVASTLATQGYDQAFGEAAVLTVFKLNNGWLPRIGDWSCMSGQLDAVSKLSLFSEGLLGNTCNVSVSNDAAQPL